MEIFLIPGTHYFSSWWAPIRLHFFTAEKCFIASIMSSVDFALILLSVFLLHIRRCDCHSWLECTDYMEKNAHYYEPEKCRGFPRAANSFLRKDRFGAESGYDHEPSENFPCRVPRNDYAHYNRQFPMAVYYPGQQVVLAHPMKEHGADADCTNVYIPDTGNWIFRGGANGRADPTLSEFRSNLVFDLSASPLKDTMRSRTYPKPGFQNAPGFCLNQDKSLGTYSFNVPLNIKPGLYTFMWLWAFNNMDDLFTTCFEVRVVKNRIERNRVLWKNGITNYTEPCGGMTSNPDIRGVCNVATIGKNNRRNGPGGGGTAVTAKLPLILICITLQLIH